MEKRGLFYAGSAFFYCWGWVLGGVEVAARIRKQYKEFLENFVQFLLFRFIRCVLTSKPTYGINIVARSL